MKVLKLSNSKSVLIPHLMVAESLADRTRGLLGRDGLSEYEGIWILRCNSIHTFFMRFSIDCIFLDRSFRVVSIKSEVRPWRLVWPQWGASSVIETAAGLAQVLHIKKGDTLHVGA